MGGDDELAAAVRAGGEAGGAPLAVSVAPCGAATSSDVIYVERPECLSGDETGKVVAPVMVEGADQLAVLGPRPWVAVAAAARAVQAGQWVPGQMLEGLRQDVLGFGWIAPSVPAAQVDRLQRDRGHDPRRAGGGSARRARPASGVRLTAGFGHRWPHATCSRSARHSERRASAADSPSATSKPIPQFRTRYIRALEEEQFDVLPGAS